MRTSLSFPSKAKARGASSFTLVEMLVAVTILLFMMVVAVQFVALASRSTINDRKKIEALSAARQAFDRIGLDWKSRIARPDVAVALTKQAGNDEIAFVTQMTSPGMNRPLSVVHFRISPATGQLERGAVGYNWTGSSLPTFPLLTLPVPDESAFQPLSLGVFRFEFSLLAKASGTQRPEYLAPPSTGSITSVTNAQAIVLAVAAVDTVTLKLVSADQLKKMASALDDVETGDPAAAWKASLNDSSFAKSSGVPPLVAQAVRVYERYYNVTFVP